ncbi:MAG: superoxide dismutase family protein [Actinomycetota bacterium]|nr:superoxide dismutase family protein [Actinomycetota bacterium]
MGKRKMLILLAGVSAALTLTTGISPALASPSVVNASGPLRDLSPAADPTDGARAQVVAVAPGDGSTRVYLILTGLNPASAGTTFGAHVHIGQCIAGNPTAALGHYNTGTTPSPQSEVWLDFTVLPGGVAVSQTVVPFEIPPGGAGAVVIHALPTTPGTGAAGARLACLPVQF